MLDSMQQPRTACASAFGMLPRLGTLPHHRLICSIIDYLLVTYPFKHIGLTVLGEEGEKRGVRTKLLRVGTYQSAASPTYRRLRTYLPDPMAVQASVAHFYILSGRQYMASMLYRNLRP